LAKEKKKKPFGGRLGQCYTLSGRYAKDHEDALLVHGIINGRRWGVDKDNPHAWIEEGEEVYDLVMDLRLPKELYYEIMNARALYKFDHEQVCIQMLKTGHWGPWIEPEDRLKECIQYLLT
jgi:hypothetical protein